jgi:hypothetical protein
MTKLAAKKDTALAAATMYEADADAGFEEADLDSYAIPFIRILQSNSPQCKKSDGAYVEGAEEGDIFNTATEEIAKGEVKMIPCHFRHVFIEWRPRDAGGGYVVEHNAADGQDLLSQCERDEMGHMVLPNGNWLVDTRMHYVLYSAGDDYMPAVLSISSTQIKKSRKWLSTMKQFKLTKADGSRFVPPTFAHLYSASTVPENNDKGSWFGWKFHREGLVEDQALFDDAKAFRDAVREGKAETKHEETEEF